MIHTDDTWPPIDASLEDVTDVEASTADLPTLVRQLAEARITRLQAEQALVEARAEWEEDWRAARSETIERAAVARQRTEYLEGQVRVATLKAYVDTGSKKPAPGVGVRVVTRLFYDEPMAREWCIGHGLHNLLRLDTKAFEKAAPALQLNFVEVRHDPQPMISADLSGLIEDGAT